VIPEGDGPTIMEREGASIVSWPGEERQEIILLYTASVECDVSLLRALRAILAACNPLLCQAGPDPALHLFLPGLLQPALDGLLQLMYTGRVQVHGP
jgi:hypothetical protein